jgi:hypothetical protein
MLYDDAEQIEVRHVISLAHHEMSIYGGGDEILEGELWIKRNAICLSRKQDSISDLRGITPPFYLFSENLSEKEDFYFAILKNQERIPNSPSCPPTQQQYDVKHIITLVQRLHSSEEQLQTRWVNAMLGRLFLALYKTPEMYEFVRKKVTKKISRVKKPPFISKIGLQAIDMGEGAPFITNPRLKDLTVDGDCTVEADINYSGSFRLEISATARIDLGPRFKAREVDLVLAVVLKKLEGHCLVRFKPPPSNRIWFCFESMPDIVMSIEPIVSARQITYGIILRAIENRIREIVAESLVFPFWDDAPFLNTSSQPFRGGIWEREIPKFGMKTEIPDEYEAQVEQADPLDALKTKDDRAVSMPDLPESPPVTLKFRKGSFKNPDSIHHNDENAISSGLDKTGSSPPRVIRSRTFSHVAGPVVTPDNVKVDKAVYDSQKAERRSATSTMVEISNRSQPNSPPLSSSPKDWPSLRRWPSQNGSLSSSESIDSRTGSELLPDAVLPPPSAPDSTAAKDTGSSPDTASANEEPNRSRAIETVKRSSSSSTSVGEKRINTIGSAAAAAKKWGWNVLARSGPGRVDASGRPGAPDHPIGRGRPLPPPGVPLPPPQRSPFKSAITIPKRKPLPPPLVPGNPKEEPARVVTPELPKRKNLPPRRPSDESTDELLVVEAPRDSEPNSPSPDRDMRFGRLMDDGQPPPYSVQSQTEVPPVLEESVPPDTGSGSTPIALDERANAVPSEIAL